MFAALLKGCRCHYQPLTCSTRWPCSLTVAQLGPGARVEGMHVLWASHSSVSPGKVFICLHICMCVCVLNVPSYTPNCKCTFSWQALLPGTCHSILLFPSVYCWRCLPHEDKFSTQACRLLWTFLVSNESLPLFRNIPFSSIMHSWAAFKWNLLTPLPW